MYLKKLLLSAGLFIGVSLMATAQTPAEKAVATAERQRFDAQVAKDKAALNKLLANDLMYCHSSGVCDTKASYIQSILDGKSVYSAIDIEEQKVRVYGNVAIINGICAITQPNATTGAKEINRLRYTDVYVKNGGQWQMATWQSLKLK